MSSQVAKLCPMFLLMAVTRGRWRPNGPPRQSASAQSSRCIRGSLRAKFILVIVALQIAVMGAVTVVVERHQREAIIEQARLRALSLGQSLATLSEGYLLGYNFAKLEQVAETADGR